MNDDERPRNRSLRGIIGGLIAFNNQSSTLMNNVSKAGDIMLMHETRIFYFHIPNQDNEEKYQSIPDENDSNDHEIDIKEVTDKIRAQLIGMCTPYIFQIRHTASLYF